MSTGRCATCRHWKREWWPSREWEFGPQTGECAAFGERGELDKLAFPIQPSESMMGKLITRPEFGCVVWGRVRMADDADEPQITQEMLDAGVDALHDWMGINWKVT